MKKLCLALAAAVFLAAPSGVFAESGIVKPTTVTELFKDAIELGGFAQMCQSRVGGCPMPVVAIVEVEDENIAGLFHYRNPNVIQVNASVRVPGTLEFNATVLHEFVHYLQWLAGKLGPASTCMDTPGIEEPAYKAAAAYFARHGVEFDYSMQMFSVQMGAMSCAQGY